MYINHYWNVKLTDNITWEISVYTSVLTREKNKIPHAVFSSLFSYTKHRPAGSSKQNYATMLSHLIAVCKTACVTCSNLIGTKK